VNLPGMPHLDTYDIVAADVPWEHDNFGQAKHGAAKASYDEMPLESVEEDPQVAGWWAWGLSCWIGGGWCAVERTATGETPSEQARRPHLGGSSGVGKGVHRLWQQKPMVGGEGGKGVHRKIPDVFGRGGKGLHGRSVGVGGAGGPSAQRGRTWAAWAEARASSRPTITREEGGLVEWFQDLAQRLRRVRVCCGDWKRVLTPAVLKSPRRPDRDRARPALRPGRARRQPLLRGERGVSADVRAWAIEHGEDPDLRIVLCGYEGEHDMPASWRVAEWHTRAATRAPSAASRTASASASGSRPRA
jgi:hypothetical protein